MKAAAGQEEERLFGGMYDRQEKTLKRTETPEREALGKNMLQTAGILQILSAVAGLSGAIPVNAGDWGVAIVIRNSFAIILCLVVLILAIFVVTRRSVGEAYVAGLLGFFIGGPYLSSTVLAIISLVFVGLSQRV